MWIKNNKPTTHRIVIADGVIPDIDSGVYSASRIYNGTGDNEGLFILQLNNVYIISDMIGDSVDISSNYPYIATGNYSLDDSRRAVDGLSIYNDGSDNYLTLDNTSKFTIYGAYLMPNDDFHENSQYDRNGVLINGFRVHENIELNIESSIQVRRGVEFLLTEDEVDSGVTVEDIADEADGKVDSYVINITPAGSWSGWYSETLTGSYQSFGESTGSKSVGHFEYKDIDDNLYLKGFDITESNNIWSVRYIPNGAIYTSSSEPGESTVSFTNQDSNPTSINLEFNDYKTKEDQILNFMIADDLT